MKLRDIMLGFKQFLASQETQDVYIIIELPADSPALANLNLLGESQWREAPGSNLFYRVDPPNPAINLLRHVHLAGKKHVNSKNKQVSWNDNGTRHDKKTFNTNFTGLEQAKAVARTALGLPADFHLEQFVPDAVLLLEGANPQAAKALYLRA
jgi:hypothetical protein